MKKIALVLILSMLLPVNLMAQDTPATSGDVTTLVEMLAAIETQITLESQSLSQSLGEMDQKRYEGILLRISEVKISLEEHRAEARAVRGFYQRWLVERLLPALVAVTSAIVIAKS